VDPDTTTEGAEVAKVGFGVVTAFFEGGQGIVFAGKCIFDAQMVVESIWPEARVKAGTRQHGRKSVADGLMGAFDGTILVQAIGSSRADVKTKLGEEGWTFGFW
jgi:hypothetical protein